MNDDLDRYKPLAEHEYLPVARRIIHETDPNLPPLDQRIATILFHAGQCKYSNQYNYRARLYAENSIHKYWLLRIQAGQPQLFGPFDTDQERVNEFDMALIDPGVEYIIFIDPPRLGIDKPNKPYVWMPSWAYKQERIDYINNIED